MVIPLKLRANPGGQISPNEVIGRDQLIQQFWEILDRQSLMLNAERRMGKTCIIKKMEAEAPEDKLPIYHDLEKVRSPLEFVETILQDVEEYLSGLRRTARRTRQLLTQISGTEAMGVKLPEFAAPHWKILLTKTIGDLVENQERKVILLWDEVPYMLGNIGNQAAMEVLDTLRSIRQMYPDVRMVFTGSIGLHHVIASLKKEGYTNEPTNDMYSADIPPLSHVDAIGLAQKLLLGENISTTDSWVSAAAIAEAMDDIPFYIHHLIIKLKMRGGTVNEATITKTIEDCLLDPLNPWKMDHYRERIDNYYNDEQRFYALNLLDLLAVSNEPLLFDELFQNLKQEPETQNKEIARTVLRLLERDYYIIRQSEGYGFRYGLIQRYWNLLRG
ncbi:ATP-binding protein [Brasilonema bromeliae]|uniref:ATP-binding protein n=1 Tax=Brasilonema bromeliae SPC951 TaxID=385972 RepID=A0ABX1P501_9CYAN|nr:ATP-binding protein [Brasilonema bromeliae]NMG19016.1 ATP-binding protein [Brasilonema bromeliae SPC951]